MVEKPVQSQLDEGSLSCPSCSGTLSLSSSVPIDLQQCPSCLQELRVAVFPAINRVHGASGSGKRLLSEDESSCFFHETKRAEAACEQCGRFLCGLCETPFAGRVLCPECLEQAAADGELESLIGQRYRHGSVALMIALVPLLVWPLTLVTAPIAIVYAIKTWNKKGSLVTNGRLAFVAAIVFSVVQIGLWGFFGMMFFGG